MSKQQKKTLTPPHSETAERALVGAILYRPSKLDDVAVIVRPEDFYRGQYATIYRHMLELHNKGRKVDIEILHGSLKKSGEIEDVGGAHELAVILQGVPTAENAVDYAKAVREHAIQRSVIYTGDEISHLGREPDIDADDLLSRSEELVFRMRDKHAMSADSVMDIRDVMIRGMADLEARMEGRVPVGMPTRYANVDNFVSLAKGSLNILAARTSVGKTAFSTHLAAQAAEDGDPVLFVSLEMSALEIGNRLFACYAGIDSRRLTMGHLSIEERGWLQEAAARLSQMPFMIDDSPSRTVNEIAAIARRQKRTKGLSLLVVDYLQRIRPDNHRDQRHEQIARISDRLKSLARELDVPILCLAQLNRQAADAKEKPRLSHLRESGAIEQDADVVMFLHRNDYESTEVREETSEVAVIIAKNRNGATGEAKLIWWPKFNRYADADQRERGFDAWTTAPSSHSAAPKRTSNRQHRLPSISTADDCELPDYSNYGN